MDRMEKVCTYCDDKFCDLDKEMCDNCKVVYDKACEDIKEDIDKKIKLAKLRKDSIVLTYLIELKAEIEIRKLQEGQQ